MTLRHLIERPFRHYADFSGRSGRAEFWLLILVFVLVTELAWWAGFGGMRLAGYETSHMITARSCIPMNAKAVTPIHSPISMNSLMITARATLSSSFTGMTVKACIFMAASGHGDMTRVTAAVMATRQRFIFTINMMMAWMLKTVPKFWN